MYVYQRRTILYRGVLSSVFFFCWFQREMERRRNLEQDVQQPPWTSDLRQSFSVFTFCAAVLLAAFIVYFWLLRRQKKSPFHRVPTMAYYMTDDRTVNTVRVDRSHYYTPLAMSWQLRFYRKSDMHFDQLYCSTVKMKNLGYCVLWTVQCRLYDRNYLWLFPCYLWLYWIIMAAVPGTFNERWLPCEVFLMGFLYTKGFCQNTL